VNALSLDTFRPKAKPVELRELTPHDRCDRCLQPAYLLAIVNNVELLFCGHHATKHEDAIFSATSHVRDERDRLAAEHGPNSRRDAGSAVE